MQPKDNIHFLYTVYAWDWMTLRWSCIVISRRCLLKTNVLFPPSPMWPVSSLFIQPCERAKKCDVYLSTKSLLLMVIIIIIIISFYFCPLFCFDYDYFYFCGFFFYYCCYNSGQGQHQIEQNDMVDPRFLWRARWIEVTHHHAVMSVRHIKTTSELRIW